MVRAAVFASDVPFCVFISWIAVPYATFAAANATKTVPGLVKLTLFVPLATTVSLKSKSFSSGSGAFLTALT